MNDPRIENLAKTIVHHSTRVQKGDRVAIRGFPLTPAATPLVESVSGQVLEAGGLPHLLMTPDGYREFLFRSSSIEQLDHVNPFHRLIMEEFDVDIRISSTANTKAMSGLDPQRMVAVRHAYSDVLEKWFQRTSDGSLRWLTTRYPTSAYAQEAEMSLGEYEDFFFASCFADRDDPLSAFERMAVEQLEFVEILHGGDHLKLSGPDIDLTLSIKDRDFIRCAGDNNLPDGEIFCGPVEDSAEGWVRFSYPCIYQGTSVQGVELEFEAGRVVNASAEKNEAFLLATLQTDDGSSRIGELGIGLNAAINRFTGDMLFDEKIAGTIHLALGAAYPKSGSTNKSAIHWDMLVDMRADSEISLDGELIYRDGNFR